MRPRPDGPQLAPAIDRVTRRRGPAPRAVTADRGYGQAAVDPTSRSWASGRWRFPAGPDPRRPGRPSSTAAASAGWSSGGPGRRPDSYLKRGYGWDRTFLDGRNGAAIWCGHGVFAHNLVKITALAG